MTKMSNAEFDQLLRSINQQPDSEEQSRLDITKQALRRRIAVLFENHDETAVIKVRGGRIHLR